ncbi:MAG: peptidase M23 [Cellvibrionales bacterium]|nr:peptidase M23 [Cellvibrionales bacterium]
MLKGNLTRIIRANVSDACRIMGLPKIRSTTRPRGATPLEAPASGSPLSTLRSKLAVTSLLLGSLLLVLGISGNKTTDLSPADVDGTAPSKALRKIYPGETLSFQTSPEGRLHRVKHKESALKWSTFTREGNTYRTEVTVREPEIFEQSATMRISSSLFLAGQAAGLSSKVIMDLAGIFGGVIDFALDPRVGDTIELVYEEAWIDGNKYADGDIVAAAFTNKGETFQAYRYTDSLGDTSYYNEDGVSMRKAFLKAPLDFTRVSSNFNPNRLHPIYKTKRPHRGTDYAAPTGTPVYAAGDGRVVEAGYTRPNGNYVFIQHGETYKTHYLHLHKRRVKKGARVKQGDIIGTVGSTGSATGPHLHYEFLVNGVHRNPRRVHKSLPKAKSLPEAELPRFEREVARPGQQLAALKNTQNLASAGSQGESSGQ